MTKADLIEQVSEKTGIDKFEVSTSIEAALTLIKENLANGEHFEIRGFGTFKVRKQPEKKARNISKNELLIIPVHYKPHFKPSKYFIDKVKNGSFAQSVK